MLSVPQLSLEHTSPGKVLHRLPEMLDHMSCSQSTLVPGMTSDANISAHECGWTEGRDRSMHSLLPSC